MAPRTTTTEVTFRFPFVIEGFDSMQRAGTYTVDIEEEQITAVSFPAWRRTATVMRVPRAGGMEHITVDPKELKEALARDAAALQEP